MLFQDLPENARVIFRDLFMTIFSKYIADTDTIDSIAEKLKDLEKHYRCTEDLEDTIYSLEEEVGYLKDELSDARISKECSEERYKELSDKIQALYSSC